MVGLKKLRMNVRAALGSDEGLKGSNRNGMSNAMEYQQLILDQTDRLAMTSKFG